MRVCADTIAFITYPAARVFTRFQDADVEFFS
jgi:hypothetical protein